MKKRTAFIGAILSLITNGHFFGISSVFFFGLFSSILVTHQEVYAGNQGALDFAKGFKKYLENDYEGALSDFDNAIKKEPNYARYYAIRAMTKYALKDYKSGLSDADKAIYLMPSNATFYVGRGLIKQRLLDREGACIDWRYALSRNRGDAKELVKKYCQSDSTVNKTKGKEFDPQKDDSYFSRGLSKSKLKDYYGAISDYTKAIEMDPQDGAAYYNRGSSKYRLKDYYGAISDYTKAIEINPNETDAYYNRGLSKSKLKDYYGAISDYTKAIEINPKYANAYYSRSIAKEYIGDIKGACLDAKKAVSLGDNASDNKNWIKDNC